MFHKCWLGAVICGLLLATPCTSFAVNESKIQADLNAFAHQYVTSANKRMTVNRARPQIIKRGSTYVATFTEQGGEITSFLDKQTGIQYMYQGDTPYWGGKNPTLFPMVGSTYTKDYVIDGKTYAMKNHGLIRYMTLTAVEGKDDEIVFALDSSEETRRQYPFDFRYEIHYTLEGNRLNIRYVITNTGEKEMPFSFGLHPGFLCPLCEGNALRTTRSPSTIRKH